MPVNVCVAVSFISMSTSTHVTLAWGTPQKLCGPVNGPVNGVLTKLSTTSAQKSTLWLPLTLCCRQQAVVALAEHPPGAGLLAGAVLQQPRHKPDGEMMGELVSDNRKWREGGGGTSRQAERQAGRHAGSKRQHGTTQRLWDEGDNTLFCFWTTQQSALHKPLQHLSNNPQILFHKI